MDMNWIRVILLPIKGRSRIKRVKWLGKEEVIIVGGCRVTNQELHSGKVKNSLLP